MTLPNVHVHLHVSDLKTGRDFYRAFLGEEPVKEKADYAKFLPSWAPLNLAISPGPAAADAHYGIQVGSRDEVLLQLARVKAAGLEVREEIGTTCCYAEQDKFWVKDP